MRAFVRGRMGHLAVNLTHNGQYQMHSVHRLIAATFIGAPPSKVHIVMHLDDDPTNNAADNLTYGLPKENSRQMVARSRQARGNKIGIAKLSGEVVAAIRADLNSGMSGVAVAAKYQVSTTTVSDIRKKRTWKD